MRLHTVVLASVLLALVGAAVAVDEPKYELVAEYDGFEVRRYAPYVLAEITVEAGRKGAGMKAFRPLARFIGGGNERRREIGMTAPVTQRRGQRIPMTAPVTQERADAETWRVGFVMPEGMTLETTPVPEDSRIVLRAVPERTMAVIRYSGTWGEGRYREHEQRLLAAIRDEGLMVAGEPVWARYDGPMTPWFLRRNEIMVEVRR